MHVSMYGRTIHERVAVAASYTAVISTASYTAIIHRPIMKKAAIILRRPNALLLGGGNVISSGVLEKLQRFTTSDSLAHMVAVS